ncbi:hypothetical protein M431DRAFT_422585 [Trichoderma harzianum CBS 226.95]|uniref:Uncharacterized protein n=1 Tax=Trichoderma harzianum CBS 226.95 TaxID=983964 RepID=A0A2T4ABX4_TRIHA|nr:hypothetical protein M431DRAFT_422585 [Trichoderma harzianum CBS 226.95]PTB54556.1 hypothetical protein M431DRAFT_422585 [Trichoderma harzianum CBS 226.95]
MAGHGTGDMRKQYAWDPTSAELGHSLPRCISISGSCGGDLEGEEINTKSGMGGIIMELLCSGPYKNESDGRVKYAMLLDKVGLKVHSAAHVLAEAGPFAIFGDGPFGVSVCTLYIQVGCKQQQAFTWISSLSPLQQNRVSAGITSLCSTCLDQPNNVRQSRYAKPHRRVISWPFLGPPQARCHEISPALALHDLLP